MTEPAFVKWARSLSTTKYVQVSTIRAIQSSILGAFTIEIILRYIASGGNKALFDDGWNIFNLSLVLISYIPETLFANAAAMTAIRVIRVFHVLRLLRTAKEIKVIQKPLQQ